MSLAARNLARRHSGVRWQMPVTEDDGAPHTEQARHCVTSGFTPRARLHSRHALTRAAFR
jgi:hypothetical protein